MLGLSPSVLLFTMSVKDVIGEVEFLWRSPSKASFGFLFLHAASPPVSSKLLVGLLGTTVVYYDIALVNRSTSSNRRWNVMDLNLASEIPIAL